MGLIDFVIEAAFVVFLGAVGAVMLTESVRVMLRARAGRPPRRTRRHFWPHGLPLKMRFPRSRLYISALLPLGMGVVVGLLAVIMGVGGGFFLVPAMIYVLGIPTAVAIGTSLFQIIFVTATVTVLHAAANQTVDVVLALILLAGAVVGAQLGTAVGSRLRGEQLRGLLALLVLATGARMAAELVLPPGDLFTVTAP